jgi:hypothetical protein
MLVIEIFHGIRGDISVFYRPFNEAVLRSRLTKQEELAILKLVQQTQQIFISPSEVVSSFSIL